MYLDQYWRHSAVEVTCLALQHEDPGFDSRLGQGLFFVEIACSPHVYVPSVAAKLTCECFTHVHSGSTEDLNNQVWEDYLEGVNLSCKLIWFDHKLLYLLFLYYLKRSLRTELQVYVFD